MSRLIFARPSCTTPALILWFLCIAAIGCRQQVFNPDEELPTLLGVTAELELITGAEHAAEYGIGGIEPDAIFVRQTIHNESSHRLKVYGAPTLQSNRIIVRTADGDEAELTRRGHKQRYPRRGDVSVTWVEPGERRVISNFPISHLFKVSEAGKYTVEVATRYTVPGPPYGYYATDPEPLTFTVPIEKRTPDVDSGGAGAGPK